VGQAHRWRLLARAARLRGRLEGLLNDNERGGGDIVMDRACRAGGYDARGRLLFTALSAQRVGPALTPGLVNGEHQSLQVRLRILASATR
jgi:hypothetical protein